MGPAPILTFDPFPILHANPSPITEKEWISAFQIIVQFDLFFKGL
jgi:hypothetical protein